MDRRSWTLLLVLAAIWGSSYMFIKIALDDLSPAMVAWSRIALAAIVLSGIAAARGALRGLGKHVPMLTLLAAIQVAGPFLLISAGETEISSALAGILVASAPLFTALLAVWVDHEERADGLRLGGMIAGLAGVTLLLGVDLGGSGGELLGGLAVLLAGLGYAIGGFMIKHRLAGLPPIGIAAAVMIASTALLLPITAFTAPGSAPGLGSVASIAVLGVLGTGLAFAIFYDLIATIGPGRATLVAYMAPGFAVVYGAALLDEAITAATIAGLVLILAGSWLAAEGRMPLLRRARPSRADPTAQEPRGGIPVPAELAPQRLEGR
jgi:drug/metabolite transporter (DMT)-like permease